MRKPLIPSLVLLASAALVALTGCSPTTGPVADDQPTTGTSQAPTTEESSEASEPPAGDQTVAESCAIANESIMTVQAEISEAFTGLSGGDFTGAIDALTLIQTQLTAAGEEITNTEVSEAVGDLNTTFGSLVEQITTARDNGPEAIDQAALQKTATDLQAQAQRVQELCT